MKISIENLSEITEKVNNLLVKKLLDLGLKGQHFNKYKNDILLAMLAEHIHSAVNKQYQDELIEDNFEKLKGAIKDYNAKH